MAVSTVHAGYFSTRLPCGLSGSQIAGTAPCATSTLTPTNTPGGPTNTPTPTNVPRPGLDFAIGIDTNQDGVNDCGTGVPSAVGDGAPDTVAADVSNTTCSAEFGTSITVNAYLIDNGGIAYANMDAFVGHPTGLTQVSGAVPWSGCINGAPTYGPDYVAARCPRPGGSTYTDLGLVGQFGFTCTEGGLVELIHVGGLRTGGGATQLVDGSGIAYSEAGPDSLALVCGSTTPTQTPTPTATVTPTATPCPDLDGDTICDGSDGDIDGDGCPNVRELTSGPGAQNSGGNRDPYNPSDYFNPTHDGTNRIDDILAVVDQYFIDQGNPNYNADTDRTPLGPNVWNLGPPNGLQRIDDILAIIAQYYHDCA